jgi:heme/copper-type cytochrome/quinol oxidase subunit 1
MPPTPIYTLPAAAKGSATERTFKFPKFYFYFPTMYGVRYSRVYAYIHYIYYVIDQFLTVVPILWLGYCGMPRRVLDYPLTLGG